MISLLRLNFDKKHITLTKDFKQDLQWLNKFLPIINGVSFFNYIPSIVIHLDALSNRPGGHLRQPSVCFATIFYLASKEYCLSQNDQYFGGPQGLACPVG